MTLDVLAPHAVKTARALLAWSQQDLAKVAKVAASSLADFERGDQTSGAYIVQAIHAALEDAGIRFMPTGGVIGPDIPVVTKSLRNGAPVRWVSAEDLSDWANRTDGAVSLPTLIASLVRATHGTTVHLRFPSDEGVRYSGWDGQTDAEVGGEYVPEGCAGWELGTQRGGVAKKADDDYQKRTANPAPIDPANATYIFVTPRHWPKKDEWAKARTAEGPWREVRAYDANDLVHWLEQTPAVGMWLATRLGKRPPGTRELDEVWDEWSRATKWPLTEALILSDRDQDAAEVLRWLRAEPSVMSLQATTSDEVVAFFHATLSELPDYVGKAYRARCLVASTAAAARALGSAQTPLVLLLTEPEPGLAQLLADRGHHVLLAYDAGASTMGALRVLRRPSREGIAGALAAAGIDESRAQALARDCARNLTVLRRLITSAPDRLPKWAEFAPPRALMATLLAGGWDENCEADKASLSELADLPYESIVAALTPFVGQFDSPLQKVGSTWRVASPIDAWMLLAKNFSAIDLARFEATAFAVLAAADPRFDIDPSERWMSAARGLRGHYSVMLRQGIGQVLILLALWGDQIGTVSDAKRRADNIVTKLLHQADGRRWWSLSRDFRLLAEASPFAFLSAIEDSLDQADPPIAALFGHDEGGVIGVEHLSDLMWALESLAWSPDWMPRVTHLLARLDGIDVKPRRYMNGPANSLRELHVLWNPQTFATLDERLRALDLIRKFEPCAAWKLMLGILPRGHDTTTRSPKPRWRDYSIDQVESVTWELMHRGTKEIRDRLLSDVGASPERWIQLLDRIIDFEPVVGSIVDALSDVETNITDSADRALFWDKLREILHHHRTTKNVKWKLSKTVLNRLEVIYGRFEPPDPLERVEWLFKHSVHLPDASPEGWEKKQQRVELARSQAANRSSANQGFLACSRWLKRYKDLNFWVKRCMEQG